MNLNQFIPLTTKRKSETSNTTGNNGAKRRKRNKKIRNKPAPKNMKSGPSIPVLTSDMSNRHKKNMRYFSCIQNIKEISNASSARNFGSKGSSKEDSEDDKIEEVVEDTCVLISSDEDDNAGKCSKILLGDEYCETEDDVVFLETKNEIIEVEDSDAASELETEEPVMSCTDINDLVWDPSTTSAKVIPEETTKDPYSPISTNDFLEEEQSRQEFDFALHGPDFAVKPKPKDKVTNTDPYETESSASEASATPRSNIFRDLPSLGSNSIFKGADMEGFRNLISTNRSCEVRTPVTSPVKKKPKRVVFDDGDSDKSTSSESDYDEENKTTEVATTSGTMICENVESNEASSGANPEVNDREENTSEAVIGEEASEVATDGSKQTADKENEDEFTADGDCIPATTNKKRLSDSQQSTSPTKKIRKEHVVVDPPDEAQEYPQHSVHPPDPSSYLISDSSSSSSCVSLNSFSMPHNDMQLLNVDSTSALTHQLQTSVTSDTYQTDDGASQTNEAFSVSEVQKQMSDDPSLWRIKDVDRMCFYRKGARGPKCKKCREFGHSVLRCPRRYDPPRCILCGRQGHLESRCDKKICTGCGERSQVSTTICPNCIHRTKIPCTECNRTGHLSHRCPDFWRRYFLTTEEGPPVQFESNQFKKKKDRSCSGCGEMGHFEHKCSYIGRHFQPIDPFVVKFDDVYQTVEDAEKKETEAAVVEQLIVELDDTVNASVQIKETRPIKINLLQNNAEETNDNDVTSENIEEIVSTEATQTVTQVSEKPDEHIEPNEPLKDTSKSVDSEKHSTSGKPLENYMKWASNYLNKQDTSAATDKVVESIATVDTNESLPEVVDLPPTLLELFKSCEEVPIPVTLGDCKTMILNSHQAVTGDCNNPAILYRDIVRLERKYKASGAKKAFNALRTLFPKLHYLLFGTYQLLDGKLHMERFKDMEKKIMIGEMVHMKSFWTSYVYIFGRSRKNISYHNLINQCSQIRCNEKNNIMSASQIMKPRSVQGARSLLTQALAWLKSSNIVNLNPKKSFLRCLRLENSIEQKPSNGMIQDLCKNYKELHMHLFGVRQLGPGKAYLDKLLNTLEELKQRSDFSVEADVDSFWLEYLFIFGNTRKNINYWFWIYKERFATGKEMQEEFMKRCKKKKNYFTDLFSDDVNLNGDNWLEFHNLYAHNLPQHIKENPAVTVDIEQLNPYNLRSKGPPTPQSEDIQVATNNPTELMNDKQNLDQFIVDRDIYNVNLPNRSVIDRSNFQGPTGLLQSYQADSREPEALVPVEFEVPFPLSANVWIPSLLSLDLNSIPRTAEGLEMFLRNNLRAVQKLKSGRRCGVKLLQSIRNIERALKSRAHGVQGAHFKLLEQRYCLLNCFLFGTRQLGEGAWIWSTLNNILADVVKFQRGSLVPPNMLQCVHGGFSYILDRFPKNVNYERLAELACRSNIPRYNSFKTKYINFQRNCILYPHLGHQYWELKALFLKFLYSGDFNVSEEHRFDFLYNACKTDFNQLQGEQTKRG